MSSNANAPRPSRIPPTPAGKPRRDRDDEHFAVRHIFQALTDLPRVMGLIWSSSHWMTITMALVSLISGVVPAVSVWITRGVVDSVIVAAFSPSHPLGPVWFFVVAQLVVGLVLSRLCTLSTMVQQLLQERLGNRVQSMILHKAETLDLTFFENADFYDKLRNASDESIYKPMQMISQVFDVLKTVVTLFSMLALLLSLAWWLAVIALLVPIPSFLSSSRYGWRGALAHHPPSSRCG